MLNDVTFDDIIKEELSGLMFSGGAQLDLMF